MYKSRRSSARKDRQKFLEENAKLAEDISALEDALVLHQRFSQEDNTSLRGVIRQELGGSRWQYGGEGKLHTFKSKDDLDDVQNACGGNYSKGTKANGHRQKAAKFKSKPVLKEDKMETDNAVFEVTATRCLNADEDTRERLLSMAASKIKGKNVARRNRKINKDVERKPFSMWDTRPGENKQEDKKCDDYGVCMSMGDFLRREGIDYDEEIAFEETSMGMSHYSEQSGKDLTDMKTKVMKKASTVLYVRRVPSSHSKDPKLKSATSQHKNGKIGQDFAGHGVKKKIKSDKHAKQRALSLSRHSGICPGQLIDTPQEIDMNVADENIGQPLTLVSTTVNSNKENKRGPSQSEDHYQELLQMEATGLKVPAGGMETRMSGSAAQSNGAQTNRALHEKGREAHLLEGKKVSSSATVKSQDSSILEKYAGKHKSFPASEGTVNANTKVSKGVFRPWDKEAVVSGENGLDFLAIQPSAKQADVKNWTNNSEKTLMKDIRPTTFQGPLWPDAPPPSVNNSTHHGSGKEKLPLSNIYTRNWTDESCRGTNKDHSSKKAVAEWLQKSVLLDPQGTDGEQIYFTKSGLASEKIPCAGTVTASTMETRRTVFQEPRVGTSSVDKCLRPSSFYGENVHSFSNSVQDFAMTAQALGCDSRVAAWLASLGLADVPIYQHIFAEHQVDFSDLRFLTVAMLQEMGITRLGPVMKILRGVDKLKEELKEEERKEAKLALSDLKDGGNVLQREQSGKTCSETADNREKERNRQENLPKGQECASRSSLKLRKPSSVQDIWGEAHHVQSYDDNSLDKTGVQRKNSTNSIKEGSEEDDKKTTKISGAGTGWVVKRTTEQKQQECGCAAVDKHFYHLHQHQVDMGVRHKPTDLRESDDPDLGSKHVSQELQSPQSEQQKVTLSAVRDLQHKLHQLEHCILHKKDASLMPTLAAGAAQEVNDATHPVEFYYNPDHKDLTYSNPKTASTSTMLNVNLPPRSNQGSNLNITLTTNHANSIYHPSGSAWNVHNEDNMAEGSVCVNAIGSDRKFQEESPLSAIKKPAKRPVVKHKQGSEESAVFATKFCVSNSKGQMNSASGLMNGSKKMEGEICVPEEDGLVVAGVKCITDENFCEESQDRGITAQGTTNKKQSLSKRQLLDEIRREKDEHRRNVRNLKLELSRLQICDPVKKSEIDKADIVFRESDLIGEGSFSQVFRGQYQGAEVAIKRLKIPLSPQGKNYFAAEVSLLRDLRHPCVVLLIGVSTADTLPVMVLEYMAGRDLYSLIHDCNRPVLDHVEFYQIARDISSGMVYLHHHRPPVLHLNLKSMNVLLTGAHRAKIADFGFSKLKHDADKKAEKISRNKNIKLSPAWMAPELLQGGEIAPKADVFSFGIIMWEMMSRKHPYEGSTVFQILELVRTNKRPDIPETCSPDLRQLICHCWAQNPAVRPNFKEVLKKIEDLSFPPGWRVLFKAAGVPDEALDDVPSTGQIISLITSRLESSAANSAMHTTEATSLNVKEKQPSAAANTTSGETLNVRPEKSIHYKEKSTKRDLDLQRTFPASRKTGETTVTKHSIQKPKGSITNVISSAVCEGDTLHFTDSLDATQLTDSLGAVFCTNTQFFCIATDDHDTLDVVSPLSSLSSSFACSKDSLEEDTTDVVTNTESPAVDRRSCSAFKQNTTSEPAYLEKLAPSALNEFTDHRRTLEQTVVSSFRLNSEDLSTEVIPGAQLYTSTVLIDRIKDTLNKSPSVSSPAVAYINQLHISECSYPKPSSRTIKLKQGSEFENEDAEKEVHAEKNLSARLSAREARRLGISRKPSEISPSASCTSSEDSDDLASAQDERFSETTGLATGFLYDRSLSGHESRCSKPLLEFNNNSDECTAEAKGSKDEPHQDFLFANKMQVHQSSGRTDVSISGMARGTKNVCKGRTRGQEQQVVCRHAQKVNNSLALRSPSFPTISPPPPPPPPPPLPAAASCSPHFSTGQIQLSGAVVGVQHNSELSLTNETQSPSNKHKVLKERYHGNPHISLEASQLVRQKGHLRSTSLPHPNQLQDVPTAQEELSSLADVLRKAITDRRFAIAGDSHPATTTSSQEFSDVGWSVQEDQPNL